MHTHTSPYKSCCLSMTAATFSGLSCFQATAQSFFTSFGASFPPYLCSARPSRPQIAYAMSVATRARFLLQKIFSACVVPITRPTLSWYCRRNSMEAKRDYYWIEELWLENNDCKLTVTLLISLKGAGPATWGCPEKILWSWDCIIISPKCTEL